MAPRALARWIVFGCLLVGAACRSSRAPELHPSKMRLEIDNAVESSLSGVVSMERDRELLSREAVEFYRTRDYAPAWHDTTGTSSAGRTVTGILVRAGEHGLRAEDYVFATRADDDSSAARADIAISLATMRYIKDLHEGRYDPAQAGLSLDVSHHHPNLSTELARLVDSVSIEERLASFAPPYPAYWRLKQALARYRALAASERWEPLLDETTIRPGEAYRDIDRLRSRLWRTGDLVELEETGGPSYDTVLVQAVQRFQERHSLHVDGVIGLRTFAALNTHWSDRIRQIIASMERWRWVSGHFAGKAIIVNVPEFRLRAVASIGGEHRVAFDSRVIVGRHYHELRSPIFSGELGYIDFRPFWNVPASVIKNEMSSELENPDYFRTRGYEIVRDPSLEAEPLEMTPSNLAKLQSGALRLRQRPGPNNALGLVKFIFPNPHSVFLHSTPDARLFQLEDRALSHGCIRVEDAAGLAAWILEGQDGWDREAIRDALSAETTTRVIVEGHVPVYILYLTAFVEGERNHIHFGRDIYELDSKLLKMLGQG